MQVVPIKKIMAGWYEWYDNFQEYAEAYNVTVICDFCNTEFYPRSPNQKRHSRSDEDDLDAIICADEQWKASLSKNGFIRLVLGMSVKDFIQNYGYESYEGDW